MRREHGMAEAYRSTSVSTAKILQDFIWASLAGIFFQVVVVCSVLRRSRTSMPNTALEPTATAP